MNHRIRNLHTLFILLLGSSVAFQACELSPSVTANKSGDGGSSDNTGNDDGTTGNDGENDDPTLVEKVVTVGVGYGSRKVASLDGWKTLAYDQSEFAPGTPGSGDENPLFRGLGFGNGLFVAVGGAAKGIVQTSADGIHWNAKITLETQWLGDVAYGNGLYVAVGGCGTHFVSEDAVNWTSTRESGCNHFRKIAFGDGRFVAVGDGRATAWSEDGVTWQNFSGADKVKRIVYGNGIFVAEQNGHLIGLRDGKNQWETLTQGSQTISGLAFGGGKFYLSVPGKILTSTDGMDWNEAVSNRADDIFFAGSGLAIYDYNWSMQQGRMYYSTDGKQWKPGAQQSKTNSLMKIVTATIKVPAGEE